MWTTWGAVILPTIVGRGAWLALALVTFAVVAFNLTRDSRTTGQVPLSSLSNVAPPVEQTS